MIPVRWLFLLITPLLAALALPVAGAQTPIDGVIIEVEGTRIEMAPADADAFQRRLNQPPLLDEAPRATPPSYKVSSAYWDAAVRRDDEEANVDEEAEYFPAGGFVRASQGGLEVWLVLNLKQRATLDRYIGYGAGEEAVERPGALALIHFASQSQMIGIEAGGGRFSDTESRALWDALETVAAAPGFIEPPDPPATLRVPGYWLTFALPEGRAQQYFVDTESGVMTDALGTENYDVSALIGVALPEAANTPVIEQQDPAGSKLWWILGLGGGAALIALAIWLRERLFHPA